MSAIPPSAEIRRTHMNLPQQYSTPHDDSSGGGKTYCIGLAGQALCSCLLWRHIKGQKLSPAFFGQRKIQSTRRWDIYSRLPSSHFMMHMPLAFTWEIPYWHLLDIQLPCSFLAHPSLSLLPYHFLPYPSLSFTCLPAVPNLPWRFNYTEEADGHLYDGSVPRATAPPPI